MKNFYLFIISILLFSCSSDYKTSSKNLKDIKVYQSLIFNNLSNWELKFDSLNTTQKFFNQRYKQIDLYKANCKLNSDKRHNDFATCVFPYVQLDNLKISFAQIRNNSSSIYYGYESTCLFLPYNQNHKVPINYYYNSTKTFFDTLKLKKPLTWKPISDESTSKFSGYKGPYISINISGDSINKLKTVLEEVTNGYFDALENRSQKLFKKDISKLEKSELIILMEGYNFELKLSLAE